MCGSGFGSHELVVQAAMWLQSSEGLTRARESTSNMADSHAWHLLLVEALVPHHVDLSVGLIKRLYGTTGIPQSE